MTVLDVKGSLGDLIKSVGPTEEQRQTFARTFLGSLLGQATILAGMMLVYVATVALLWKYASDELSTLYATVGFFAFCAIIAAPLVFILLFSMLPTGWRALRERRLKATVIGGDVQFKPGYFRLHPYGVADRDAFKPAGRCRWRDLGLAPIHPGVAAVPLWRVRGRQVVAAGSQGAAATARLWLDGGRDKAVRRPDTATASSSSHR
jgi:hypothetical protein